MNRAICGEQRRKILPWHEIDTIMLDMDGTLLDKYFDDYFWEKFVPQAFARKHDLAGEDAEEQLLAKYRRVESTLQWTDLYFWTEQLGLDIVGLKRQIVHLINVHDHVLDFLGFIRSLGKTLFLVTNAHPKTLEIKLDRTGIGPYFDKIVCAEEIGAAKEEARFWQGLERVLVYEKERTMFADDTEKVLRAAQAYGIGHLVHVARPSSRIPLRYSQTYHSIGDFGELLSSVQNEFSP